MNSLLLDPIGSLVFSNLQETLHGTIVAGLCQGTGQSPGLPIVGGPNESQVGVQTTVSSKTDTKQTTLKHLAMATMNVIEQLGGDNLSLHYVNSQTKINKIDS